MHSAMLSVPLTTMDRTLEGMEMGNNSTEERTTGDKEIAAAFAGVAVGR